MTISTDTVSYLKKLNLINILLTLFCLIWRSIALRFAAKLGLQLRLKNLFLSIDFYRYINHVTAHDQGDGDEQSEYQHLRGHELLQGAGHVVEGF